MSALTTNDTEALNLLLNQLRSALSDVEQAVPDPNDLDEWLDDWGVSGRLQPVFERLALLTEDACAALGQAIHQAKDALAGVTA